MERSPLPTTLEVSDKPIAPLEKQSAMPQIVFNLLRYFADKLAPYRTPEMLHFPPVVDQKPGRSHYDSLIAKVGYTVEALKPETMTDRELVAWVARYLSNDLEPISGDKTSDKSKIDFIIDTIDHSTTKFRQNLESAVFNLLRTISRQQVISLEVAALRRNLKDLSLRAKFASCQQFFQSKSKRIDAA